MKLAITAALAAVAILFAGCEQSDARKLATQKTDNPNYGVDYLFSVEGCHVYRFDDEGYARYLTICPSGQASVQSTGGCGKGCAFHHDDMTVRKPE